MLCVVILNKMFTSNLNCKNNQTTNELDILEVVVDLTATFSILHRFADVTIQLISQLINQSTSVSGQVHHTVPPFLGLFVLPPPSKSQLRGSGLFVQ